MFRLFCVQSMYRKSLLKNLLLRVIKHSLIRIRVGIWIGNPDQDKGRQDVPPKSKEISCFEVLDVRGFLCSLEVLLKA